MATTFSNTLQPSNNTDALFRAWAQFVHDTFAIGGWIQTNDTGQINLSTVTRPLAATTVQGYELWRMDDSLQGSFPVYVKVEYGSGNLAANSPAVSITLGTGTNGSGTITGSFLSATRFDNGANTTSATNIFSHGSASPSHIALALFDHATQAHVVTFSLERMRDTAGTEIGTKLVLIYSDEASGIVRHNRVLLRAGGSQPTAQTTLTSCVVSETSNNYLSKQDVGLGLVYPQDLVGSGSTERLEPSATPALGYIVTPDHGSTTDAIITVYVYGRPHVYRRFINNRPGVAKNTNIGSFITWIRHE